MCGYALIEAILWPLPTTTFFSILTAVSVAKELYLLGLLS